MGRQRADFHKFSVCKWLRFQGEAGSNCVANDPEIQQKIWEIDRFSKWSDKSLSVGYIRKTLILNSITSLPCWSHHDALRHLLWKCTSVKDMMNETWNGSGLVNNVRTSLIPFPSLTSNQSTNCLEEASPGIQVSISERCDDLQWASVNIMLTTRSSLPYPNHHKDSDLETWSEESRAVTSVNIMNIYSKWSGNSAEDMRNRPL